MKKISELLEKFSQALSLGIGARGAVAAAVKNHCGADISESNIEIKDGVARIKAPPAAKSEIFIKQAEILVELQRSLGPRAPKELR